MTQQTNLRCRWPGVSARRSVMHEARSGLEVPVQHEGIEVGPVRPHDGAQLVVYLYLSEVAGIGQRLEDGAVQIPGEIDIAFAAVAKAKRELVVTKDVYRGDANKLHAPILRQRVDGLGRTSVLGPLPVCFQLFAMQTRPLGHELERAAWETAYQHLITADHNRRVVLGVFSVEVGRIVVVEVHRDDDPVEEADAGHGAIMSAAADGDCARSSTPIGRLRGKSEAARTVTARRQRPNRQCVTNRVHRRGGVPNLPVTTLKSAGFGWFVDSWRFALLGSLGLRNSRGIWRESGKCLLCEAYRLLGV
jgi:hypothetical protein